MQFPLPPGALQYRQGFVRVRWSKFDNLRQFCQTGVDTGAQFVKTPDLGRVVRDQLSECLEFL